MWKFQTASGTPLNPVVCALSIQTVFFDQEIFSTEEMIAAFDLPQIGRSPARFDFAKLENLNGHYIRRMANTRLLRELELALPYIDGGSELQAKLTPTLERQLRDRPTVHAESRAPRRAFAGRRRRRR